MKKPLKDYTILYDAECPICTVYSKKLVSTGLLEGEGRKDYQTLGEEPVCLLVDKQRAANEIALVNNLTGEVEYGISGIIKIVSNAYPLLGKILKFPPLFWILKKIYMLIAYNRRVITPPYKTETPYAVQPQFKLDYRLAYIILAALLSGYLLMKFRQFGDLKTDTENYYVEYLFVLSLIVFQSIVALIVFPSRVWDYLGNLMTITAMGALMLLPMLAIATFAPLSQMVYIVYLIAVGILMFVLHFKRMRQFKKGWVLNITWLVFYCVTFILMVM